MKLIRSALSTIILATGAANAATIVVDNKGCDLPSAILAANTDTLVGRCPAGHGPDVIDIRVKVKLKSVYDDGSGNYTYDGLAPIVGKLTVNGHNNQIVRTVGEDFYRLFHVSSGGDLTLNKVWLRFGQTNSPGGAILNETTGKLTINRSTISENDSGNESGGAIANFGDVKINKTTIANNKAWVGGGIYSRGPAGHPTKLIITNSTVSGNYGYTDGAFSISGPADVQFTNVTITGNKANVYCGGYCGSDGAELSLKNTVMADSFSYSRFPPFSDTRDCISDTLAQDLGGDFIQHDGGCQASAFSEGTDPKLSPLAMYGGPTPTHLPMNRSPLLTTGVCVLATDQRGSKRSRTLCDIGAVGVYKPLDTLFLQFDGNVTKRKLKGIGKTKAQKTKRVNNYRNLLVAARNGKIQKNRSLMCGKLSKAYKKLDTQGRPSGKWITGKAAYTLSNSILNAKSANKCQ